jgi:bifunctional non-homologous end joining protein LigD
LSDKYQRVTDACRKLRCRSALIDGEIIVQDEHGVSDFAALLVMFAFDLLFLNGADLRRLPLIEKREKLRKMVLVDARSSIQFNDHYDGEGAELFKRAWAIGLEGIVSKRALSPYKSGPSGSRIRMSWRAN